LLTAAAAAVSDGRLRGHDGQHGGGPGDDGEHEREVNEQFLHGGPSDLWLNSSREVWARCDWHHKRVRGWKIIAKIDSGAAAGGAEIGPWRRAAQCTTRPVTGPNSCPAFSSKGAQYAFGETDQDGRKNIQSFAAQHRSVVNFMPFEERVYFVSGGNNVRGLGD
jgi:hypothetical protein